MLKVFALAGLLLTVACASAALDDPAADAGTTAVDAAVAVLDSGAAVLDSGVGRDAAEPVDAALIQDGGDDGGLTLADAGSLPDAGPARDRLLTAAGGALMLPDGSALDFRGAISCCGGGYGWPLVDEAWIDYVSAHGINFLHMRLGPFLTGPGGESDWASTGGGYPETNGVADLDHFNPAFWSRVGDLIAYARAHGAWVEIDIIDGWAIRHCRRGDIGEYSAWAASNNVQGEDLCAGAGGGPVAPGSRHDLWVRKVVAETGRYDNVVYQDGNEIGLLGDYDPSWTLSLEAVLRDEEQQRGYARHLFGTNSGHGDAINAQQVDYVEEHGANPVQPANCAGKPCLVNEYNPDPPLTPAEIQDRVCEARAIGTYFWYWRHGQAEADMEQSLSLMSASCP